MSAESSKALRDKELASGSDLLLKGKSLSPYYGSTPKRKESSLSTGAVRLKVNAWLQQSEKKRAEFADRRVLKHGLDV